jgi:hypothetical protein
MNKKEITRFVQLATQPLAYDFMNKQEFAALGKKLAKFIAKSLGLQKGSYTVRWNPGGDAVSGEVVLHTEHLYINLGQSCLGNQFMYRWVKDQNDYIGGRNRWMNFTELLNIDLAIATFKNVMNQKEIVFS